MIYETISLHKEDPKKGYFQTYIIEDSPEFKKKERPVVIICPGGGYTFLSDREAEVLAMQYNAMGCHAVVLYYSVAPATFPTALLEMADTILYLREHAAEWHIDPQKIIMEGASAGGHLCASYGMFWTKDYVAEGSTLKNRDKELLRPNGMILCYPVITSGKFAHRDSFVKLLGDKYEELLDEVSLEDKVNENTPPTFIWHTFPDNCVPVENSLLLVNALVKASIQTEFHMFPKGGHGLSLANEICESPYGHEIEPCCESWISLVKTWIYGL